MGHRSSAAPGDARSVKQAARPSLVKSATRVLQVFDFFDDVRRSVTQKEIAESLLIPQSSAGELLHTMVRCGYLIYDAQSRLYAPSTRASLVAAWAGNGFISNGPLLQLLRVLGDATEQTVGLARKQGASVQFIYVRYPMTQQCRERTPVGAIRPICSTIPGAVFLRDAPEPEIHKMFIRAQLDIAGSRRAPTREWFDNALNRQRREGYAFGDSIANDGFSILSALYGGRGPAEELVVSLTGPRPEMTRRQDEYARILIDAIAQYAT